MKKIVFTRPDGGISVLVPQISTFPERENISEEQALQRAWKDVPPEAINPVVVDEVPVDKTFREAWIVSGGVVEHDMAKCRELHKDYLRRLRAPKFQALDVAYLCADEAGDADRKAAIVVQKQALRDVTKDPEIAKAQTPEELKLVIPAALAEESSPGT